MSEIELTEAEQARIIAAGVAALEEEEQEENRRHYRGPRNPAQDLDEARRSERGAD